MASYYKPFGLAVLQAIARLQELDAAQANGTMCAYDARILKRCLHDLKRARQATPDQRWRRILGRASDLARTGNFDSAIDYVRAGLSQ